MNSPAKITLGTCPLCKKKFANSSLKNRHMKRVHQIIMENTKKNYIMCPLCKRENKLGTHDNLRKHLEEDHDACIEKVTLQFSSNEEYQMWKTSEKIDTNYAMYRSKKLKNFKQIYYDCNRSNNCGYEPKYYKITEKSGGSIKMHGVCPSRLIVTIYYNDGKVTVDFWKTHAGHEKKLRSTHLSAMEKNMVIEKLQAGIPVNQILEDARKMKTPQLERINLLNRNDVVYLSKKYDIKKKQDKDEMIAAVIKVEENVIEKTHDVLAKENFSVDFMNTIEKVHCKEEVEQFVESQIAKQIADPVDETTRRDVWITRINNWIDNADDEAFESFVNDFKVRLRKEDQRKNKFRNTLKKVEKQENVPKERQSELENE